MVTPNIVRDHIMCPKVLFLIPVRTAGCWITDHFEDERIALEYFWMWLAAMGNIVIYVLLAFLVKGTSLPCY